MSQTEHFAPVRLVLHIDVDAFFASVEQLVVPSLRGRPVIVGSGCIASCSYEARRRGLRAGMALHEARRLCPQAVILEGNYQIYRCFAEHIWEICRGYTVSLETYLDEAYGDATGMDRVHGGPLELGRKLRRQVLEEVGLPVSIGLAGNRMMAGMASHFSKPSRQAAGGEAVAGVMWIAPGQEEAFLAPLAVEELLGVGHKTAQRLRDMNISTVGQLRLLSRPAMAAMFGRRGETLYERCRGRDIETVSPAAARAMITQPPASRAQAADEGPAELREEPQSPTPQLKANFPAMPGRGIARPPRTISRETTFHEPTCDLSQIHGMLFYLLERAMRTARRLGSLAGCVELSIRYNDWKQAAASRTLEEPTDSDEDVFAVVLLLLGQLHRRRVSLRHVGVVLSRLSPRGAQGLLFQPRRQVRNKQLHQAVDAIRDRYGHAAVVSGKSIELLGELQQNDYGFILRTPSLTK